MVEDIDTLVKKMPKSSQNWKLNRKPLTRVEIKLITLIKERLKERLKCTVTSFQLSPKILYHRKKSCPRRKAR